MFPKFNESSHLPFLASWIDVFLPEWKEKMDLPHILLMKGVRINAIKTPPTMP